MRQTYTVIPCYKEPLERVLRTVNSALAVENIFRVVVVDDGTGRPELDELTKLDRVDLVRCPVNGGPSAAMNAGIETLPDDSVICRLDVGDVFYPEAKARQVQEVLDGKYRASCSPHHDPVKGREWFPNPDWETRMYYDSQFTGCTVVVDKSVWREVGKYESRLRWCEDWFFSIKVQYKVGFHLFPEVTCSAGMFPGGHSDTSQDPAKKKLRDKDQAWVVTVGRALMQPEKHRHLYNEKWCKKRGLLPIGEWVPCE